MLDGSPLKLSSERVKKEDSAPVGTVLVWAQLDEVIIRVGLDNLDGPPEVLGGETSKLSASVWIALHED